MFFPQMELESVPFCLVVFVVQFGFPKLDLPGFAWAHGPRGSHREWAPKRGLRASLVSPLRADPLLGLVRLIHPRGP